MPMIDFLRHMKRWLPLAILLQLSACATENLEIWRQIPIQTARISQSEKFTLNFRIDTPAIAKLVSRRREDELDRRMDSIFINLIGAKNWQLIKNLYGVSSVREELLSGDIHMEGLFNFNIYLDPPGPRKNCIGRFRTVFCDS